MRLRILLICIIIVLSGSFARPASACTCGIVSVAEYLKDAKAVFVGEVISKRKSDAIEKDGVEVTLKVERVWKGRIEEQAIVYTGATDDIYPFVNLCATPFRVGERYIVFAYSSRAGFTTNVCAGSGDFPYAEKVMKQLGRGRPPLKSKNRIGD